METGVHTPWFLTLRGCNLGVKTPRLKPRVKNQGRGDETEETMETDPGKGFLPLGCNHGLKTKGYIPLSLGEVPP